MIKVKPKAKQTRGNTGLQVSWTCISPHFTFCPLTASVKEAMKRATQGQAFSPKISADSVPTSACYFSWALISYSCLVRGLIGNVSPLTRIPGFKNKLEAELQRHRCSWMSFPWALNILLCLYISSGFVLGHVPVYLLWQILVSPLWPLNGCYSL